MPKSTPSSTTTTTTTHASRRTPTNFDARVQWPGCVGAIRNQLHCGGCWAFAAAETLSDRFCIATHGATNVTLSPQDLISCGHVRTPPKYLLGCDGGVPEYAWQYMEQTGISTDACIPFVNTTKESCPAITNATCAAKQFKVAAGSTRVLDGAGSAVQQDMSDPVKGGPVQAVFYVYQDFFSYKAGVYKHSNMTQAPLGKHSIKIVGYGLDKATFENYWLAANSWGDQWGMDGYFKIAIGQCEIESEMVFGAPLV